VSVLAQEVKQCQADLERMCDADGNTLDAVTRLCIATRAMWGWLLPFILVHGLGKREVNGEAVTYLAGYVELLTEDVASRAAGIIEITIRSLTLHRERGMKLVLSTWRDHEKFGPFENDQLGLYLAGAIAASLERKPAASAAELQIKSELLAASKAVRFQSPGAQMRIARELALDCA
jgi:hypothetical protein